MHVGLAVGAGYVEIEPGLAAVVFDVDLSAGKPARLFDRLAHLCWSLENLAAGTPVNVIEVDGETSRWALVALERMLEVG